MLYYRTPFMARTYIAIILLLLMMSLAPIEDRSVLAEDNNAIEIYNSLYTGFMGVYDYDNDSVREIFIFYDEYINVYNPYGGLEVVVNLTNLINPRGIRALYYHLEDHYMYLSTIYVVSSPSNRSYWIVSFIIVDLMKKKIIYNEPKIITNLPGFTSVTNAGIPGLYRLHLIDGKYIIAFYNGFSMSTNPIIFAIYNIENKTLYYRIVYEDHDFPTLTLPATHMITSALVPGGEDPYPLIRIDDSYEIIMPNREVYVFHPSNGTLEKIGVLNISDECIVKYVYDDEGEVFLLAGPKSYTDPMKFSIYEYNLYSGVIRRLYSFDIENIDYGRLVAQSLAFNDVKGFFIKRLSFPGSNGTGEEYQSRFTRLALLFTYVNGFHVLLNLTTNSRPVSQLFEINDLYVYMTSNYRLKIIDPLRLYIGEYDLGFVSKYFTDDTPCYIIYPYNSGTLVIAGIKYIGVYRYRAKIMIVNSEINISEIQMRPLDELYILPLILSTYITLLFSFLKQNKPRQ